ncbi:MAG: DUF3108 domain-containing protein [Gemmatimonadota bacterium]
MRTHLPRGAAIALLLYAPLSLLPSFPALSSARGFGQEGVGKPGPKTVPGDLPWRFPVGERAEYVVTFGPVRVGRGILRVEAIDTVGVRPAYRVAFELRGGTFFYRVDDRSVSWVAPEPIRSLRFEQRVREGSYRRHRRYTLNHEAGTYMREDWDGARQRFRAVPVDSFPRMPPAALDEISYLYLVRALPLEVGRTYEFARYFQPDGNPVVLEVLRRETVRVPAGRFRTIVVRPVIRTGGLFAEEGRAEVHLSDDERRVVVLLRTRMRAGEMNLYLRKYDPGRTDGFIARR